MASFAVDETDIQVIKESARQQQTADSNPAVASQQAASSAPSAAAAANGLPASGAPAADAAGDSTSPFANGAPGSTATEDSPAAAAAVADLAYMLSMVSCADIRAGEFTYAAWTQEMADMKVRRWKSLMPVLTPNSELTTREMVRVLQGVGRVGVSVGRETW